MIFGNWTDPDSRRRDIGIVAPRRFEDDLEPRGIVVERSLDSLTPGVRRLPSASRHVVHDVDSFGPIMSEHKKARRFGEGGSGRIPAFELGREAARSGAFEEISELLDRSDNLAGRAADDERDRPWIDLTAAAPGRLGILGHLSGTCQCQLVDEVAVVQQLNPDRYHWRIILAPATESGFEADEQHVRLADAGEPCPIGSGQEAEGVKRTTRCDS